MPDLWDKLVIALDLGSESRIKEIIRQLSPKVRKFKIGPVAFIRFGPRLAGWVKGSGADIFLDFKFYDIPNTMVDAAKALVDLGAWSFTVHLKAGRGSLSLLSGAVSSYAEAKSKEKPLIFGVTELTSCRASAEEVLKLAKTAKDAGIDGVVCSVREAEMVKRETGLLAVTPGIRQKPFSDDQKRTATLKDAVSAGCDYVVVGRPVVKSSSPYQAAEELIKSARE